MNILEYENTQETKTHGDLQFPFNIYLCSIPLDFSVVPDHWHNDMEIIYIKKGRGQVSVDLTPYQVREGEIVLVAPGQLHGIRRLEDFRMEYENILFRLDMLMPATGDICSERFLSPLLHNRLTLPTHLSAASRAYTEVAGCLDKLDRLSSLREPAAALGIKGTLFDLFYRLFSLCKEEPAPQRSSRSLEYIKRILKHVETSYQNPLSVADMAKLCGYSASHFMKFFKQNMGQSFTVYLNDYRLTMAARLLSVSEDTVAAVAQEAGFENLSYFNRAFKRKYGVTPTAYRRESLHDRRDRG